MKKSLMVHTQKTRLTFFESDFLSIPEYISHSEFLVVYNSNSVESILKKENILFIIQLLSCFRFPDLGLLAIER